MVSAPALLDQYLTVEEAVERSQFNPQYVRRLLRRGLVNGFRKGHSWLIETRSLEEYLKEGEESGDGRRGPRSD